MLCPFPWWRKCIRKLDITKSSASVPFQIVVGSFLMTPSFWFTYIPLGVHVNDWADRSFNYFWKSFWIISVFRWEKFYQLVLFHRIITTVLIGLMPTFINRSELKWTVVIVLAIIINANFISMLMKLFAKIIKTHVLSEVRRWRCL